MGFGKYKNNPPRRIDIRFVPFESYISALVYFTGSVELNKKMRNIAKNKKLKLSEYGIFKENGEKLIINEERDIFNLLNLEYLVPRLR
jgi:DNA polymerase/3'-5' exonuclease PolX